MSGPGTGAKRRSGKGKSAAGRRFYGRRSSLNIDFRGGGCFYSSLFKKSRLFFLFFLFFFLFSDNQELGLQPTCPSDR